jgi:FkbM family methyltransferase
MSILEVLLWPLRHRRGRSAGLDKPAEQGLPQLTLEQYEQIAPILAVNDGGTEVRYFTPNRFTHWRVQTLFTKEPDTIAWIKGFARDEVLVDIGANVGMYTIWAAKTRGARVYAFEPESQNFAILYKNIVLNDLGRLVTAYCAALSDEEAFSLLYLSDFQVGSSCHTFGAALDHNLASRRVGITQGCVSSTLDRLVERGLVPVPQHIKIDVDGLEHKVLAGCRDTLREPRVKSVLVEINTNLAEHRQIVEELLAGGFRYSAEQVAAAQRKDGAFKGVGNYVFQR